MAGTFALIVAAGRGTRFGAPLPKQYQQVAGRAVLGHAVAVFARHPRVAGVRVVIHPDDRAHFQAATAGQDVGDPLAGGATRQDSVRLGLEGLAAAAPDRVLIHDAARPCVAPDVIGRVIDALDGHDAVIPALPVVDALKRAAADHVTDAVDRAGLVRAQTPQGFRYGAILAAHRAQAGRDLPDDAAVAAAAGHAVALVAGDEDNIKVTTAADLDRVARALAPAFADVRTGTGFDVHRFGPGDHVMLGGVRVPHDRGLVGHSDADVALHALVDALLGTVGAGDIGVHFPPSEARWRGADSALFVEEARRLVAEAGGRIANVDVTIVGERPRVGPHRAAIRARIAGLLGIDEARVNVKATTTEGLGFTGRAEGLACQASATVSFGARP